MSLSDKFGKNISEEFYTQPKSQGLKFTIEHYAGKVSSNCSVVPNLGHCRCVLPQLVAFS